MLRVIVVLALARVRRGGPLAETTCVVALSRLINAQVPVAAIARAGATVILARILRFRRRRSIRIRSASRSGTRVGGVATALRARSSRSTDSGASATSPKARASEVPRRGCTARYHVSNHRRCVPSPATSHEITRMRRRRARSLVTSTQAVRPGRERSHQIAETSGPVEVAEVRGVAKAKGTLGARRQFEPNLA